MFKKTFRGKGFPGKSFNIARQRSDSGLLSLSECAERASKARGSGLAIIQSEAATELRTLKSSKNPYLLFADVRELNIARQRSDSGLFSLSECAERASKARGSALAILQNAAATELRNLKKF